LATKFGIMRNPQGEFLGLNGRPEYIRQACEASLKSSGLDHTDLYYQYRMDQSVPIEETMGAMVELVKEGKIKYLGLSEPGISAFERASTVHPISALQSEFPFWSHHLEVDVLVACKRLSIGLVPRSSLAPGF
jgi:aryl-alcohol dehydrogenase-like predicted oxidoreductase